MILDLKGKLIISGVIEEENTDNELLEALKGLGYKDKEIKVVIPRVDKEKSIEEQIKEALRLLVGK